MCHFTTTIQYVCKEREEQPENDNIDNDNSLHPEGLLFFWHRSKLITYTIGSNETANIWLFLTYEKSNFMWSYLHLLL